ncbi:MurR/RpiR family transcriptional regulator [Celeribacter indicus]|uniref:HTH rpiR-type domain-containing protein n=1 Tax=Celeribacter indicus TaxID=1208324 RepID=A0A0B5E920_9RHOB|nr:MurR/RpiR family transcriptional regulator [Celeribacter indicus]AJE48817.1 hypothetical protein P73_4102 [Celeribacter indicus]SDW38227.1 transcriptional regulator, RpiR family [Celeribacter indicus]
MENSKPFTNRLNEKLETLHPAEKRLGLFLRDFPGELASYSVAELADLAEVSKATVSRFIRRLGYASYEEARHQVRAERETGSRFYLSSREQGEGPRSMSKHFNQGIRNLERTFAGLDEQTLTDMTAAFFGARKIWVLGFRASRPLAAYLTWQLLQVFENITDIPGQGETLGEHLISLDPGDLVVMFGLRRRVAIQEKITRAVAAKGATLLYITDEGAPDEPAARWQVRCHTATAGSLFNHVAVMAVCHLIADRLIEASGREGLSRLRGIESLNTSFAEL